MADEKASGQGGFHFGPVGGNVNVQARGDVVGRDKVMTTTTTTGLQQADKDQFLKQIEELRSALRELKAGVEAAGELGQDERDELVVEITQRVVELKVAKEQAAALPAGSKPAAESASGVKDSLDKAGMVLQKVGVLADRAAEVGGKLGPVLAKALPLLASARSVLGQ